jgi:hypothetical protein
LTIVRAWFVAGSPTTHIPAWGSFEDWSAVIRQIVTWLGLPDPASTREEFRQAADRETTAVADLIDGLLQADPNGGGLQAAEIIDRVEKEANSHQLLRSALLELCSTPTGRLNAKSVGRKFAQLRGQIVGGQCIDSHDRRGGAKGWYVRHVDRPAEDMSG